MGCVSNEYRFSVLLRKHCQILCCFKENVCTTTDLYPDSWFMMVNVMFVFLIQLDKIFEGKIFG